MTRPGEVAESLAAISRHDLDAVVRCFAEDYEWRLSGTRNDGWTMDFVEVNIFGVADGVFRWGRIHTELVRDSGGMEAQLARMTGHDARAEG